MDTHRMPQLVLACIEPNGNYKNITDFSKVIKKGIRSIVLIENTYEDEIFLSADGVIDCMVSEYQGDETIFYKYSSKQRSEIKSSYLKKGFCYRMCTSNHFETLPKVETNIISKNDIEKYVLLVCKKQLDVKIFFQNIIQESKISECLKKLKYLGCLNSNNSITYIGENCIKFPFSVTSSCILTDWKEKKPIFPMLVLLVFSELRESFIQFPNKDKKKTNEEYKKTKVKFIEETYKETYTCSLELYLKIFIKILKQEKTIDIISFGKVCKNYSLNYLTVKNIFKKLKNLLDIMSDKIEIGIFDVNNLISLSKEYFEKYAYNNIGKLVNVEKGLYLFPDSNVYKLDYFKHFGDKKELPYHIISFDKIKINDSQDSIQKRKNLVYYFMPLDNLYIET